MSVINPHKAIDFLIKTAPLYAQAKANRVYLEQFRKTKKALLMAESTAKTSAEREQYAYAHPEYLVVIDGLKAATEEEETYKWKMEAARIRTEVWRSMEASNRGQDKAAR